MRRCIPTRSVHLNRSDIRHDIRLQEHFYKRFKSSALTGMPNTRPSATKLSTRYKRPNWPFFRTWLPLDVTQKSFGPTCVLWNPIIQPFHDIIKWLSSSTSDHDKAMMLNSSFFYPALILRLSILLMWPAALPTLTSPLMKLFCAFVRSNSTLNQILMPSQPGC